MRITLCCALWYSAALSDPKEQRAPYQRGGYKWFCRWILHYIGGRGTRLRAPDLFSGRGPRCCTIWAILIRRAVQNGSLITGWCWMKRANDVQIPKAMYIAAEMMEDTAWTPAAGGDVLCRAVPNRNCSGATAAWSAPRDFLTGFTNWSPRFLEYPAGL